MATPLAQELFALNQSPKNVSRRVPKKGVNLMLHLAQGELRNARIKPEERRSVTEWKKIRNKIVVADEEIHDCVLRYKNYLKYLDSGLNDHVKNFFKTDDSQSMRPRTPGVRSPRTPRVSPFKKPEKKEKTRPGAAVASASATTPVSSPSPSGNLSPGSPSTVGGASPGMSSSSPKRREDMSPADRFKSKRFIPRGKSMVPEPKPKKEAFVTKSGIVLTSQEDEEEEEPLPEKGKGGGYLKSTMPVTWGKGEEEEQEVGPSGAPKRARPTDMTKVSEQELTLYKGEKSLQSFDNSPFAAVAIERYRNQDTSPTLPWLPTTNLMADPTPSVPLNCIPVEGGGPRIAKPLDIRMTAPGDYRESKLEFVCAVNANIDNFADFKRYHNDDTIVEKAQRREDFEYRSIVTNNPMSLQSLIWHYFEGHLFRAGRTLDDEARFMKDYEFRLLAVAQGLAKFHAEDVVNCFREDFLDPHRLSLDMFFYDPADLWDMGEKITLKRAKPIIAKPIFGGNGKSAKQGTSRAMLNRARRNSIGGRGSFCIELPRIHNKEGEEDDGNTKDMGPMKMTRTEKTEFCKEIEHMIIPYNDMHSDFVKVTVTMICAFVAAIVTTRTADDIRDIAVSKGLVAYREEKSVNLGGKDDKKKKKDDKRK